ncbi:hypothetical protein DV735_g3453, partial [Chaetothyriales sp. CBS 134920]
MMVLTSSSPVNNIFFRSAASIGHTHGSEAQAEVAGSLAFYQHFFQQRVKVDWSQATAIAGRFLPHLQDKNADYNWDWEYEQSANLVNVRIEQQGRPTVEMMTEAGLIGKIGLNSAGVGVTLNAIQAVGVSYEKLPCHLALRTVLDSGSRAEAEAKLRERGVASACHIQIADKQSGGVGFECTSVDIVEMATDGRGITTHTNHLVREHLVEGKLFLNDSVSRLTRVGQLLDAVEKPDIGSLTQVLKDEQGYPCAINRDEREGSKSGTLFSIVMDLTQGYASVKIGRPTLGGEEFVLRP